MLDDGPEFQVKQYVWIILGWYRDRWWTEATSKDDLPQCSDDHIESLLPQTIGIQMANSAEDIDAPTDVNLVSI